MGHLDSNPMGMDRKCPSTAEIQAELLEVLCNFKDYKIERDAVSSILYYCMI